MSRPDFLNFKVDHMTLLVQPELYNVAYVIFRTIFGCTRDDIVYNDSGEWEPGQGKQSLTYAMQVGQGVEQKAELARAMIAVVQPTEPMSMRSHVREMLDDHRAAAHWQHIALRTSDLFAFHAHAIARGVNFITPINHEKQGGDLLQVFTGEWYFPGSPPSGMFFEFVQRNPTEAMLQKMNDRNRESWFNDETFRSLYTLKEKEYQSGVVTPFLDPPLFDQLLAIVGDKKFWDITEADIQRCEQAALDYALARSSPPS